MKEKVFVGMSGGVDSSVAAFLLRARGYDVAGVYLKCFVRPDGSCKKEAMDAMAAAKKIGIPFEIWDFEEEYKKRVIDYMIDGYRKGITPNPDILCNKEIKFGLFLEEALKRGADYVATGHYAKLAMDGGKFAIFQSKDLNKDQTYFLWTLTQEQLKHSLFPVGDYLKSEVREIARKAGLPTAEKKDSQGVCFLGPIKLEDFLSNYINPQRGKVKILSGGELKEIGEHKGAHLYTIGQRRGIGNLKHEKGVTIHEPLYVVDKDLKSNTVVVARREEADAVDFAELENLNMISGDDIAGDLPVWARFRYRQKLVRGVVKKNDFRVRLVFDEPQKFVAAGQSAVFYEATERGKKNSGALKMLGGGVIV